MYAIFENGSKQYKASVGDVVKLEKLDAEIGATVTFPVILTADDKGIQVGKEVEKVVVTAEVLSQGKDKKIIVFKYKSKKNERKKQGHRQPYTQIKVTAIGAGEAKKKAEAKVASAEKETAAAETEAKKPAAKKAASTAKATTAEKPATAKKATTTTTAKKTTKAASAAKAED
ncbi:MAG: 50S ribosomal protein L21 [Clostridia bacterium]|nr:50S ribosomal protein L21 [Clostridia bacterium]